MCLPFSLFVSTNSSRSDFSIESHTPLNDHWIFNANIVCLKSFTSFFNHWFRIQSSIDSAPSFTTTQIGLASMFQSFVVSILRMKIRNLWEWNGQNYIIEFDSMFKIEMCYTWSFCRLATIEWRLSSEWTGLYSIVL